MRLLGLPPEHDEVVSSDDWTMFVAPDYQPAAAAAYASAMTPGGVCDCVFRPALLADGTRWLHGIGRVERDPEGRPWRMLGINVDVTARRQAETALAAKRAELEAIYDEAPVGMALIGRDRRFQRINEALAAIRGVSVADTIGRTVAEIVPDADDAIEPLLTELFASGKPRVDVERSGATRQPPHRRRHCIASFHPCAMRAAR